MTSDEWNQWVSERPVAIQEVARRWPGWHDGQLVCYRSTQNVLYHYTLYAYDEGPAGVTVRLIHGADSTLPGVMTFGQPLDQLVPCDCGRWKYPTPAQAEATRARLERYRLV